MRIRLALVAAIAASITGLAAGPASASCYPEKPQTCEPCRITGIYFDENGIPRFRTECP
ncbi:MAG TPA: hypothetical protein VHJ76_01765 [Actinomycetota bacterium]|nr:hypothetical protein [Actinomycetota bacterium]